MIPFLRGRALLGAAVFACVVPLRADEKPVVVTATRLPLPEEEVPAAVTTLRAEDLENRQIDSVADALRDVPGLDVVQTGTPGQVTSVFTRGLKSEHTQVLLDGIAINQGLAGAFNFADLATTGLGRIEVQRGPQSTLYGPRALAGSIQLFSSRGQGAPRGSFSFEGGSFGTFRERAQASGKLGEVDFLVAGARLDTDNDRPNNQYRATSFLGNFGWSPRALPNFRLGVLATFSRDDASNPGPTNAPTPTDNLLTKRWLLAPNVEWQTTSAIKLRAVFTLDREEQVNDPQIDSLLGSNPTKAVFRRTQADLQGDFELTRWLTLTAGGYYGRTKAEQYRPLYPASFGEPYLRDVTESYAGFAQASLRPLPGLLLVLGGRVEHFNDFGTIGTWRVAGSYVFAKLGLTLRTSYATGFAPPSPQDKIFRFNTDVLDPEKSRGFDAGFEQRLAGGRVVFGASYFYNRLSNIIGFNDFFETLNLGRARTQGLESFVRWEPLDGLQLRAAYTYLDARRTSAADISQPDGARLPRRARNTLTAGASYQFLPESGTPRKRAAVGLDLRYVNAREELNFGAPNSDVPDYTVLRVWAHWQATAQLRLFARVENLTDRRYEEVPRYPNPGRAFFAGATWSFGGR
ncbi:MAG: TonB-dependent receptor [Verrucomicrobia bacterium]|nr:TonB-dependent receptor [Verrucomicrobiota bacterium]